MYIIYMYVYVILTCTAFQISWARIHERSYPGLRLIVETFVSCFCPKTAKTFVLGLVVFTKNLRTVLSLAKGSTLRLVGSGLKFCKED